MRAEYAYSFNHDGTPPTVGLAIYNDKDETVARVSELVAAPGDRVVDFCCSLAVDDIHQVLALVETAKLSK